MMISTNTLSRIVGWVARVGSAASIAVLALFMFGGEEATPLSAFNVQEAALFACFPIGVIAGMALGWFRQLAGAALTAASLIAFYAVHLAFSGDLPGGPWFIIFALPGLLFGAAWMLRRGGGASPADSRREPTCNV